MMEIEPKYLDMAIKVKINPKYNVNEFMIAEMLSMKDNSLWYSQIKSWSIEPPQIQDLYIRALFKTVSSLFIECVDNEYKIPDKYSSVSYVAIQDFLSMTEQLRNNSLIVISPWIPIITKIILFNSKHLKKEIIRTIPNDIKMKKCIANDCEIQVDITKKRSGACSIEHTKYYCKKCKCWHHYGTKAAEHHTNFKLTNWIKNKEERESLISHFLKS